MCFSHPLALVWHVSSYEISQFRRGIIRYGTSEYRSGELQRHCHKKRPKRLQSAVCAQIIGTSPANRSYRSMITVCLWNMLPFGGKLGSNRLMRQAGFCAFAVPRVRQGTLVRWRRDMGASHRRSTQPQSCLQVSLFPEPVLILA